MELFKEKDRKNDNYKNKFVEIFTTGTALFFIGGIFYIIYIICNWIVN